MHDLDLIQTLTGGLSAALILGYITHRLGLSPIVGYLLAGVAVGPFTPGFVADLSIAEQLAEVGVILLMFGVGLEFHFKELLAVRRIAVPGAVVQSVAATAMMMLIGRAFDLSWSAGLVFGLCLSVASTVVLIRVLADNRALHTPAGHIAVGWLVVEDLFTVLILVLLPVIFGPQADASSIPWELGFAVLKVGMLVAGVFVIGGRIVPSLFSRVAATRSRELFTLTVLAVALGIAVGSARLFGVSMALGAFLAGMVVGRSEFSLRAATEALPMRDAFAVLFFVSVGMLLNPRELLAAPGLTAATLAIVLVCKPLAALGIVLLLRYPVKTALAVSAALAQIGEFSFLLGMLGKDLGVLSDRLTNVLAAAAIVSITVNPLMYRMVKPVESWASHRPRLGTWSNARKSRHAAGSAATRPTDSHDAIPGCAYRAVVVGYGPVGRTVSRLLRENDIEPTIIELNMDTVRTLKAASIPAVYGDATHRDTLRSANITTAGSLILSASDGHSGEEVIRLARELNPAIQILARANYVRDLAPLRKAGAEAVFSGESEVALAMTESILRGLGATHEQIDRERDRVRTELLGVVTSTILEEAIDPRPELPKAETTASANDVEKRFGEAAAPDGDVGEAADVRSQAKRDGVP